MTDQDSFTEIQELPEKHKVLQQHLTSWLTLRQLEDMSALSAYSTFIDPDIFNEANVVEMFLRDFIVSWTPKHINHCITLHRLLKGLK